MKAALSLGIVLSTGLGVERIDPPDVPGIEVKSARWGHVRPEDSSLLVEWSRGMRNGGVSSVALVAASRGVPVAQKSVPESDGAYNGGVVFVSGAGGPAWSPYQFARDVSTPGFLMCGVDESDRVLYRMDMLNNLLLSQGKETCLKQYDGNHGFLADNEEAQSDMRGFLRWTLAGGGRPEWFTKCPK